MDRPFTFQTALSLREDDIVNLQVGERRFTATRGTLIDKSLFFFRMLVPKQPSTRPDGSWFIDADPDLFEHILRFLRRGVYPVFYDTVKGHDLALYHDLLREAKFYEVFRLQRWLEEKQYMDAVKVSFSIKEIDINWPVPSQDLGPGNTDVQYLSSWVPNHVYLCPRGIESHKGHQELCGRKCRNMSGYDEIWDEVHVPKVLEVRKHVEFAETRDEKKPAWTPVEPTPPRPRVLLPGQRPLSPDSWWKSSGKRADAPLRDPFDNEPMMQYVPTSRYEAMPPGLYHVPKVEPRENVEGVTYRGPLIADDTAARLERLEKVVSRLADRLGEDSSELLDDGSTRDVPGNRLPLINLDDPMPKGDSSAAPVMVIRDLVADTGIELPKNSDDVPINGLVPTELAMNLISIFSQHYGRWVLFDDDDPETLLPRVRKSPLLFCASCLIAVRHTSQDIAARLAPKLYDKTRSLVQSALLLSPQPIEFFQAALVLCMWSTTVGQVPLSIDSWLLSGFALQHCQSSALFSTIINPSSPPSELDVDSMKCWFLWNHLCLVHLHYCVGTSRRSMLQEWHIARCRAIVGSDHTTNYELRMVAEVYLYHAVYDILARPVDITESMGALQAWKKEWQFVLEQPRAHFLMMGFHFAHLLIYDRYSRSKTTRAHESILAQMTSHSKIIIKLAMDTVDERTRHLSDHIYHMITYAAITLCRMHDQAPALGNDELDSLISKLIEWLQSIGLSCHVSHTFATIISQIHQKARPQSNATGNTHQAEDVLSEEFTRRYFPEFLGIGSNQNGSWDTTPSFAFFPQDYALPDGI
ncbi:hypothetical protein BDV18DRAFT_155557 [Aspergillus unguis]